MVGEEYRTLSGGRSEGTLLGYNEKGAAVYGWTRRTQLLTFFFTGVACWTLIIGLAYLIF